MNTNTKPRICGECDKTDGKVYAAIPPRVKCAISGEYRGLRDRCNQAAHAATEEERGGKPRICEVLGVEDIALINRLSRPPLTANDVYAFKVQLCDNEIDCDFERFTAQTLADFSSAVVGKVGIFDNSWNADVVRIYKSELVIDQRTKTKAGDTYCRIIGYAFLPRTEKNTEIIEEIERRKKQKISIGCSVRRSTCSICGRDIGQCEHRKGEIYDERLCFSNLDGLVDVFEWSFVAQPARQPRFTADEVATMRVLSGAGYAVLARDQNGCLCAFACKPIWAEKEWIVSPEDDGAGWDTLPRELFPSLLPGQSLELGAVIGQKENRPG